MAPTEKQAINAIFRAYVQSYRLQVDQQVRQGNLALWRSLRTKLALISRLQDEVNSVMNQLPKDG